MSRYFIILLLLQATTKRLVNLQNIYLVIPSYYCTQIPSIIPDFIYYRHKIILHDNVFQIDLVSFFFQL